MVPLPLVSLVNDVGRLINHSSPQMYLWLLQTKESLREMHLKF